MTQKIVCFCGQMAVGKDEAADHLFRKLDWNRTAWGNNVKFVYMESFGVSREFIEQWKRQDESPPGFYKNIRESLMFIGDGFRQMNPNVWVDWLFRDFPTQDLIISDGRYFSECDAVRSRGGINVAVWRPGYENNIDHPSESQLKPEIIRLVKKYGSSGPIKDDGVFDYLLLNDGDLSKLFTLVEEDLVPYINSFYGKS